MLSSRSSLYSDRNSILSPQPRNQLELYLWPRRHIRPAGKTERVKHYLLSDPSQFLRYDKHPNSVRIRLAKKALLARCRDKHSLHRLVHHHVWQWPRWRIVAALKVVHQLGELIERGIRLGGLDG